MAIVNHLFERPATEDVTHSLGNMMVSGVENEGSRRLYFNLLLNLLVEKKTIILVNGALSGEQHRTLRDYVRARIPGRSLYDLRLGASSASVDILSAFRTNKEKADFLLELLSQSAELSDSAKLRASRFFLCAMSALDASGKTYRLKDLAGMDVDRVSAEVTASPLPAAEKNRHIRFLEDAGTYAIFLDLESALIQLESSGVLDILSGSLKMKDLLRDGNVVMLSGMLGDDFEKKEMLLNALFQALSKCLEREKGGSRVAFLIKNADFISGDHIRSTLEYNQSYHFAAYLFVEDITRYIAKNGNAVLDDVRSFLVFTQGSPENAAFWSAFFGSRDIQQKSYSFTKKRSWNPFSISDGGVVPGPGKYNTATTNFTKVNEPIYKPEVFRELRKNEVMCYLREPLLRKKTSVEE